MVEVLAKAKKYINGEEAVMFKRGSSSAQKEKSKDDKSGTEALEDEKAKTDLHRGTEKTEIDL